MSTTIVQRRHVRVRLMPVMAVLTMAVVAAVAIALIERPPSTSPRTVTSVGAATVQHSSTMPASANEVIRHRHIEQAQAPTHLNAVTLVARKVRHDHRWGGMPHVVGAAPLAPPSD